MGENMELDNCFCKSAYTSIYCCDAIADKEVEVKYDGNEYKYIRDNHNSIMIKTLMERKDLGKFLSERKYFENRKSNYRVLSLGMSRMYNFSKLGRFRFSLYYPEIAEDVTVRPPLFFQFTYDCDNKAIIYVVPQVEVSE